jgi:flagellum-specific ATP synthase
VFAQLPRLVERAGNDSGPGSITALYTCLAEGDDLSDPVVDCARAALDGHIVLSRKLANAGHYPAVDVLASISRVMNDIVTPEHRELALLGRELLAAYRESADLIEVGAYVMGSNPRVDRAIRCRDALAAFLRQRITEAPPLDENLAQLRRALNAPNGAPVAHA